MKTQNSNKRLKELSEDGGWGGGIKGQHFSFNKVAQLRALLNGRVLSSN